MADEPTYNPVPQSTPVDGLTLLDIVRAFNSSTGKEYSTRFVNVGNLLQDTIEPLFSNIQGSPYSNQELGDILTEITKQIMLIKSEIEYQHIFNGNLIFELQEQGIKFESEILLNELNYIQ